MYRGTKQINEMSSVVEQGIKHNNIAKHFISEDLRTLNDVKRLRPNYFYVKAVYFLGQPFTASFILSPALHFWLASAKWSAKRQRLNCVIKIDRNRTLSFQ